MSIHAPDGIIYITHKESNKQCTNNEATNNETTQSIPDIKNLIGNDVISATLMQQKHKAHIVSHLTMISRTHVKDQAIDS